MSETDWDERRDFEEALADGRGITVEDAQRLITDADAGERAEAVLEGLKEALRKQLGIEVVDVTTDDDEGDVQLELVRVEGSKEAESAIVR